MADAANGSWSISGTTATYKIKGLTVATLSGVAKNLTAEDFDGVTVTEADLADDGSVNTYGKITLTNAVLGTTGVTVKSEGNAYELALKKDDVYTDESEDVLEGTEVWKISGTTATYKKVRPAYYTINHNGAIVYNKETDMETLATVTGLAKGLVVGPDGSVGYMREPQEGDTVNEVAFANMTPAQKKAKSVYVSGALTLNDKAITLTKDALTTTSVKVSGEGYTLSIDNDSLKPETKPADWKISGTTATYKIDTTAGWTPNNTEGGATELTYSAASSQTLATVKGLAKGLTDDDLNGAPKVEDDDSTEDVDESKAEVVAGIGEISGDGKTDTTITLSNKVLGTTNVTITNGTYKDKDGTATKNYKFALALGEDVTTSKPGEGNTTTPPDDLDVWRISGTTAIYKKVTPAYYELDGGTIYYTAEKEVKDSKNKAIVYATITGLASGLKVQDGTSDGETPSVFGIYDANGEFVSAVEMTAFTEEEKDDDGNVTEAFAKGTITLNAKALGKSNVAIKGGYYDLAVDTTNDNDDYKVVAPTTNANSEEEGAPTWTVKNGTATLTGGKVTAAGFTLSPDAQNIYYTAATADKKTQALVTIGGLNKTFTKADDIKGKITVDDATGTVTIDGSILGTSNVTLKEKNYKLQFGSENAPTTETVDDNGEKTPPEGVDVWRISGTTATYKKVIPAYYSYDEAKNSYIYHAEADAKDDKNKAIIYAVVTGLKSGITFTPNTDAATGGGKIKIGSEGTETSIKDYFEATQAVMKTEIDETTGGEVETDEVETKGVITFKDKEILGATVKLDKKYQDTYKLAVDNSVDDDKKISAVALKDSVTPVWSVSGTTATLKGETQDGYTITDNEIKFVAGNSNATLATIKNLAAGLKAVTKKNDDGAVTESFVGIEGEDDNEDKIYISATEGAEGAAGTIALTSDVLNKKTITLEGVGNYVLSLGGEEDSLKPKEEQKIWKVSGTTAELYKGTTLGYELDEEGQKKITYSGPAYTTKLATVTGLKSGLTVKDDGSIKGIEVDDTKITFTSKDVLAGNKNTKVAVTVPADSGAYTLALGEDMEATPNTNTWFISGTTATLVKGTTDGYSVPTDGSDKGKIVYTEGQYDKAKNTLVTITGLKSGLKVGSNGEIEGISIEGNEITLNKRVLGTGTVKVINPTPAADEGEPEPYTLALVTEEGDDNAVTEVTYEAGYWNIPKNGTATYTVEVNAGYKISDANDEITYVRDGKVVTTLNNLNIKTSDLNEGAIKGIALDTGANQITINVNLLNKKAVTVGKNSDYTLKFADETLEDGETSQIAQTADPVWNKTNKDTKATYTETTSAGYSLSEGNKTINYSNKATTKTLATLSGLKKELTAEDINFETDIVVGVDNEADSENPVNTITLNNKDIFDGKSDITLGKNDNYELRLGGEEDSWEATVVSAPYWNYNNGTATLTGGKSAGYAFKKNGEVEDRKTILCTAATEDAYVTVSGLAKDLKVSTTDGNKGKLVKTDANGDETVVVEAETYTPKEGSSEEKAGKITLSKDAVTNSNVTWKVDSKGTHKNDKYEFAFADDDSPATTTEDSDDPPKQVPPEAEYVWRVSGTTATYKQINPAYYTIDNATKKVVYHPETNAAGGTIATITGLKKGVYVDDEGELGIDVDTTTGEGADAVTNTEFKAAFAGEDGFKEYEEPGEGDDPWRVSPLVLTADVLPTGKVAIKSDYYTLGLAEDVDKPEVNDPKWKTSGTNATLTANITEGWALSADNKTITYNAATNGKTLATISGIKSGLNIDDDDAGIFNSESKTLTFKGEQLNKTKVTLKDTAGLGYKLAMGSGSSTLSDAAWNKTEKETKATYAQTLSSGYTLADDEMSISYSAKDTTKVLATINGLVKAGLSSKDLNDGNIIAAEEGGLSVITLKKEWLGQGNITLGRNDPYIFSLGDDAVAASMQAVDAHWRYNANGTAEIVSGTTEGWYFVQTAGTSTLDDNTDDKFDYSTIKYAKADYTTHAAVTGLAKNLDVVEFDPTSTEDSARTTLSVKGASDTDDPTAILSFDIGSPSSSTVTLLNKDLFNGKAAVTLADKNNKDEYTFAGLSFEADSSLKPQAFGGEGNDDNPEKWYISGTTAYLKKGFSEGWVYGKKNNKDNPMQVVYQAEAPDANDKAVVTITGLKKGIVLGAAGYSLAKGVEGEGEMSAYEGVIGTVEKKNNVNIFTPGIALNGTTITINDNVLGTTNVSLGGDSSYTFDTESESFTKAGASTPVWSLSKGTATLKQTKTAGFTLGDTSNHENSILTYQAASKAGGDVLLTISGLKNTGNTAQEWTAEGSSGISIKYETDDGMPTTDGVITLTNDMLNKTKVTLKATDKTVNYSLSLATGEGDASVAREAETLTEWVVNGTTATYKTYDKGYYSYGTKTIKETIGRTTTSTIVADPTVINYTADTKGTTYSTITGLSSGVEIPSEAFDAATKVFKLTDSMLQKNGNTVKITGDAYTFDISGISTGNLTKIDGDGTWTTSGTTATFKGKRTAGYTLSEDGKTFTWLKAKDTKEQEIVKITGLRSGAAIKTTDVTDKVITLNEKQIGTTVKITKGDGYKLALGSLSAPDITFKSWNVASGKATLKGTNTAGYTLSNDAKTITYIDKTALDKTANFATITGLKSSVTSAGLSTSVNDEDMTITLGNDDLTSVVGVNGGFYAFSFKEDYKDASITGSANADSITVAGTGISINAGNGDDFVTFTGKGNTFFYASGNGNDVIANFSATDKINVTNYAITEQNIKVSGDDDAVIVVGKGEIKLTGVDGDITIIDKSKKAVTYTKSETEGYIVKPEAEVESNGLIADDNYIAPTQDLSAIVSKSSNSIFAIKDLNASQNLANLDKQSEVVAYSGDDK